MADVEPIESSAGRMLATATALFAGDDYDGIPLRTLAIASGLAVAPIHCHCGSKLAQYRAVLSRLAKRAHALIIAHIGNLSTLVIAAPPALQQFLNAFIDALIDPSLRHPEFPRLWVRRWLEQDGSPALTEIELLLPLSAMMFDVLQQAQTTSAISLLRLIFASSSTALYGSAMAMLLRSRSFKLVLGSIPLIRPAWLPPSSCYLCTLPGCS